MVFQGSLNDVSIKYQGCFIHVSRKGSFKGISRKFQESLKGVVREFLMNKRYFKEVLRMIYGCFRVIYMKFPWCFKKVSSVLHKSFWCVSWMFQGFVESISRVNQDSFEGVSGVCLRVFEASSKGVLK